MTQCLMRWMGLGTTKSQMHRMRQGKTKSQMRRSQEGASGMRCEHGLRCHCTDYSREMSCQLWKCLRWSIGSAWYVVVVWCLLAEASEMLNRKIAMGAAFLTYVLFATYEGIAQVKR